MRTALVVKRSARSDYNCATAQLEKRSPPDCSRNVRAATTVEMSARRLQLRLFVEHRPRRAPTIRQKARLLVPKIMLVWRACWRSRKRRSQLRRSPLRSLALSQARCSHKATNARTATSRAAQMRMLQKICRVAGSFFAMAIAVASDATSQRAAVAQRLTNFGRSLRIYRI